MTWNCVGREGLGRASIIVCLIALGHVQYKYRSQQRSISFSSDTWSEDEGLLDPGTSGGSGALAPGR
jgi:hypothetical protein